MPDNCAHGASGNSGPQEDLYSLTTYNLAPLPIPELLSPALLPASAQEAIPWISTFDVGSVSLTPVQTTILFSEYAAIHHSSQCLYL